MIASALAFAPAMAKNIEGMADLMTRIGLPIRLSSKTTQLSTRVYRFLENNFDVALLEIRNSNKGYQQSLKNNTILKNI